MRTMMPVQSNFNPPYSVNVKTNVGEKFLSLLDKHFPPGHPLHPLLNRRTVKVSYKCLPNMKSIIAKNNSKVLNSLDGQGNTEYGCNCRKKTDCPLPGKCKTPALIYQATVETDSNKETYVGLSAPPFKERFYGHKGSFTHEKRKKETSLSIYIWELKLKNEPYTLSWALISRAQPFSQVTGICQLCTREKYIIAFKSEICTLNKRNELLNSCRHKQSKLLVRPKRKLNPG